jgi:hypothetical protein
LVAAETGVSLQVQQRMLIVIGRVLRGLVRKNTLSLLRFASAQIFRTNQIADALIVVRIPGEHPLHQLQCFRANAKRCIPHDDPKAHIEINLPPALQRPTKLNLPGPAMPFDTHCA